MADPVLPVRAGFIEADGAARGPPWQFRRIEEVCGRGRSDHAWIDEIHRVEAPK